MKKIRFFHRGFTLIELLLVLTLLSTILTLVTINLFKPTAEAKIDTASADIVSILREAQNKAINTETAGEATSNEYGVHFESDKYTLFKGLVFNPADPNNFVVDVPEGISLVVGLPSNNVVFRRISGEVIDFDRARNTICIKEAALNKTVLLRLNFVGVVDVVQQGC